MYAIDVQDFHVTLRYRYEGKNKMNMDVLTEYQASLYRSAANESMTLISDHQHSVYLLAAVCT